MVSKLTWDNTKVFLKTSMIGGMAVVLPVAAVFALLKWLLNVFASFLDPFASPIIKYFDFSNLVSDFLAALLILILCFLIGMILKTTIGRIVHSTFERKFSKLAPGYKMAKSIVNSLLNVDGDDDSKIAKGEPALCNLFGVDCSTQATGFVTAYSKKHEKFSCFFPTAPVPASGMTYHLNKEQVTFLNGADTEEVLKTIVACGVGSDKLFDIVVKDELDAGDDGH